MGENAFCIEQILVKNAQCIEQNYHKIAFCIEQMMDWIMKIGKSVANQTSIELSSIIINVFLFIGEIVINVI